MFDMTELIDELRSLVKIGEDEAVERIVWEDGQIVVDFGEYGMAPIFIQRTDTCYWWEAYQAPYTGEIELDLSAKEVAARFWDQVKFGYYNPNIEFKS